MFVKMSCVSDIIIIIVISIIISKIVNLLLTGCIMLHCVQDTDLSRNVPGKVKVSAPNLHVKHKHK